MLAICRRMSLNQGREGRYEFEFENQTWMSLIKKNPKRRTQRKAVQSMIAKNLIKKVDRTLEVDCTQTSTNGLG